MPQKEVPGRGLLFSVPCAKAILAVFKTTAAQRAKLMNAPWSLDDIVIFPTLNLMHEQAITDWYQENLHEDFH